MPIRRLQVVEHKNAVRGCRDCASRPKKAQSCGQGVCANATHRCSPYAYVHAFASFFVRTLEMAGLARRYQTVKENQRATENAWVSSWCGAGGAVETAPSPFRCHHSS